MSEKKCVLIITGEASGDMYAARLVAEMQQTNPDLYFFGMGGDNLRKAGVEILVDAKDLAVVGLVEILSKFNTIYSAFNIIKIILKKNPPDLIILIDYPGFNLRVAKMAKKYNIKVLYYISPQIWAWRKNRIYTIKKYVDHMAVILPFEAKIYEEAKIPVTFVGHPIVEQVTPSPHPLPQAREGKLICLMPGSRSSEIKYLLPIILESARILKLKYPTLQFILPIAPTILISEIDFYLKNYTELNIQLVHNKTYDAIKSSHAVITASGTATLEIALLGVPMVIIYKLAKLSYLIFKKLAKINYIGLCNIIAQDKIVPELIQGNANPEKIAFEIKRFLEDPEYYALTKKHLAEMKIKLGEPGASKKVAALAMELLE